MKKILFFCVQILLNFTTLFGMFKSAIPKISDTQTLESIFVNTSPEALFKSDLAEKCLAIWLLACKKPNYVPSSSTQSDQKLYKCPIPFCYKIYFNRKNLGLHVLAAHSKKRPYACPIPGCFSRFKNYKGLPNHLKRSHHVGTKTNQKSYR